jgi:hypothetical protein
MMRFIIMGPPALPASCCYSNRYPLAFEFLNNFGVMVTASLNRSRIEMNMRVVMHYTLV